MYPCVYPKKNELSAHLYHPRLTIISNINLQQKGPTPQWISGSLSLNYQVVGKLPLGPPFLLGEDRYPDRSLHRSLLATGFFAFRPKRCLGLWNVNIRTTNKTPSHWIVLYTQNNLFNVA
jgi:hypothetical protein